MRPSTKVTSATLAAAVATILIWLVESQGWIADVPTGVELAVTVILTAVAGYVVPETNPSPSAREAIANGN